MNCHSSLGQTFVDTNHSLSLKDAPFKPDTDCQLSPCATPDRASTTRPASPPSNLVSFWQTPRPPRRLRLAGFYSVPLPPANQPLKFRAVRGTSGHLERSVLHSVSATCGIAALVTSSGGTLDRDRGRLRHPRDSKEFSPSSSMRHTRDYYSRTMAGSWFYVIVYPEARNF